MFFQRIAWHADDQDGGVLEALQAELLLVLGTLRVEVAVVDAAEAKDCHAACHA